MVEGQLVSLHWTRYRPRYRPIPSKRKNVPFPFPPLPLLPFPSPLPPKKPLYFEKLSISRKSKIPATIKA